MENEGRKRHIMKVPVVAGVKDLIVCMKETGM
jgi:hypothetical protein